MLIEGLLGQGVCVSALCPFESSLTAQLRARGCQVHIAMLEEAMEWRSLLTATEIIRRQAISIVHTHLFNATFLGSLAGYLMGAPVVATVHGMYISPEEMALARLTSSHIITVCTAAYTMGLAMGMPEDQISLIPNGVDTQRFRPDIDGRAFRQQLGIPQDVPLVGMVSRLAKEKGPDLFLQAVTVLATAKPDAHFVYVGEGPMRQDIEREVRALGLDERVHMCGLVADTSAIYPGLDVVCLPSRIEGQPLSLLEAMAAARPLVAANVGGIPELVKVGETGWLVARGDVNALAERVLWLLDNPAEARQMGQEARKRVCESFDAAVQTSAINSLFRRLVDGRRPQSRSALRFGRAYSPARVS